MEKMGKGFLVIVLVCAIAGLSLPPGRTLLSILPIQGENTILNDVPA